MPQMHPQGSVLRQVLYNTFTHAMPSTGYISIAAYAISSHSIASEASIRLQTAR